jgi:hypothetical protein
MSYAAAPTFESNRLGSRNLSVLSGVGGSTLRGWGLGGFSTDILTGMMNEGYDPSVLNALLAAGATDAQMQSLWDNTAAGSPQFASSANSLLSSLTGGPGGAASAPGYPQAAVPTTVSSAFGTYDLTQEASWNAIASLFSQVQQLLNQTAQLAPRDADTIANVTQFNSLVVQWAGYYQQAFGSAPGSLPMASIPSSGLGALGVIPVVVVVALVAGVAGLLTALYGIYQWTQVKKAQITANQQVQSQAITAAQAQANNLMAQAATLDKTNPTLAAQLRTQASQLMGQTITATNPNPPGALTSWFTSNWAAVAAVVALLVIAPPLIKKF